VSAREFAFELSAGVVHDRAGSTSRSALSETRSSPIVRSVLLNRRVDDLVATRDGKAVLTPDLTRCSSLSSNFGTESVDFVDNEALHAINVVFFLECKVEDLIDGENEAGQVGMRYDVRHHSWAHLGGHARRRGRGGSALLHS
jgi:hypothetical protein